MLYRSPPPPAFKYANHKNNRTKKINIIQLKNRQTNKKQKILNNQEE